MQGNTSPDGVLEALPSQLLRKWKRASKMLNVACVLTKLPHRERYQGRVEHSYWSRSVEILSSHWLNLTMP